MTNSGGGGGIDTRVEGEPGSISAAASWMGSTAAPGVGDGADAVRRARTDALSDWGGDAGPAFAGQSTTCDDRHAWTGTLADRPPCPTCGSPTLRPDVWFGEVPHDTEAVERALLDCDPFVAIGTPGLVYPAAAYVHHAIGCGADTLELNLGAPVVSDFSRSRRGPPTETVPAWVDELLAS